MRNYLSAILQIFWIGLCALSMLSMTRLRFGIPQDPGWLDGFVFGGMVFGYHFTRRERWRKVIAWMMGALGFLCYLQLPGAVQLMAWVPGLVWGAYYGWQKPGNAGLRGMPYLKPLAVAFAWAWVTVMLPLPQALWASAAFVFGARAAFVFALALAYDLHDKAYDAKHGLTTLAGRWDSRQTFQLIDWAMVAAGVFAVLHGFGDGRFWWCTIAVLVSLAASDLLIRWFFRRADLEPWRKVLIDALMPLQWLVAVGLGWWGNGG
jgi:4-hydroxybenzoate polyprenyltransferase